MKQRSAFTLLEAVIYLSLLSLLFLGLVYFLIGISQTRAKAVAAGEVQANARQVLTQLGRLVASSASINWSASQLDVQPGRLTLVDYQNRSSVVYLNSDQALVVSSGGQETVLTDNLVRLTDLVFQRYDDKTVGLAFSLEFWPQGNNTAFTYGGSWQTSLALAD